MKRIITASKSNNKVLLKVAKKHNLEKFVLVKEAMSFNVIGGKLTTAKLPVGKVLLVTSSGDTIYDSETPNGIVGDDDNPSSVLPVGNPDSGDNDGPGEPIAKGGVIFFSTDIDDRNAMWKRRIDTDPDTKQQKMVRKFDLSIDAIRSAVKGWAKTLYNRFNRKSKQRDALMRFFNENKVFVGHTVFPKGEGSYINPYQEEPDTRPQYSEEQSYVMMCKGLTSELLTELADFIRVEFDQAQVLIQDDNTGRVFLYP